MLINSNTTLVKVKFIDQVRDRMSFTFKYNTC